MGAVIRRTTVLIALLALLVPTAARASTTTYGPPYGNGPSGGDTYNRIDRNGSTGEMSILRYNPVPANGTLGCAGNGGWATFTLPHTAASDIVSVTLSFRGAIVDPYSFMSLSVYRDDHFVDTHIERGPILGDGTIVLEPRTAASGEVTLIFGLQAGSSCPNVQLARAVFDSVIVVEA
ncbi:MAG TPA: hypothetical protein VM841_15375 [Actinomycetota bacterium]|nr:hypothetical protein [Actinomycetota bacterium]